MIRIHTLKHLLLCSTLALGLIPVFGQQTSNEVSLLFVGDVMQHGPQIKGAYNAKTDTYEYEHSWRFIKPTIEAADIAIANLEVTHAGKPYSGYPQFSAPDDLSRALKNCGFDVLITANNHSCDGGSKGVIRTLDVLDSLNIPHTGTFRNKEEREKNYPYIIEKNNLKIALLNYTYGTNGLFVKEPLIINYIDSAVIRKDIQKAKQTADYIICTIHWGDEYKSLPNSYQKHWEKFLYENGVDMIVGSHPHVIQPVERKVIDNKERLTAYSLGNFVSNQRDRFKNGGLILRTTLQKSGSTTSIKEADFLFAYVHTSIEGPFKHYYVLPDLQYEKYDSTFFTAEEIQVRNQFFSDSRSLMAKHAVNVREYTPTRNHILQHLTKGYYAICVGSEDSKIIERRAPNLNMVHTVRDFNGQTHYLIGYTYTVAEAEVNKKIVASIYGDESKYKIVFVNRFGIKEIK